MNTEAIDQVAYKKVVEAFKRQPEGLTIADVVAKTALPFHTARELVPLASDEYSGRLKVTESGEILYSFPGGFKSRYRGFGASLRRGLEKAKKAAVFLGTLLFKAWIMAMLVGYFVLFMAIAVVALAASVVVSSSGSSNERSSSRRGGGLGGLYIASYIFNLIIRIWFYSELTKSLDGDRYGRTSRKPKGKPLHQAVFSFAFGDGDPNADWEERENKALLAYIQANRGVISLPEYMALTGKTPAEAERGISAYCVKYDGMPEATEGGTVVYRFDALLLRADRKDRSFAGLSAPIKRLQQFSMNNKKMNFWFIALNGVNLLFGAYFLFTSLNIGPIVSQAQIQGSTYLYAVAYILFSGIMPNPLPMISFGLGFVPLAFAFLFYLIPSTRYFNQKKNNDIIRMENLRKETYRRTWEQPIGFRPVDINPVSDECRPNNLEKRRDEAIKELGTYSIPDIGIGSDGSEVYTFKELDREKGALAAYRKKIDPDISQLGKTVFDSHGDDSHGDDSHGADSHGDNG